MIEIGLVALWLRMEGGLRSLLSSVLSIWVYVLVLGLLIVIIGECTNCDAVVSAPVVDRIVEATEDEDGSCEAGRWVMVDRRDWETAADWSPPG